MHFYKQQFELHIPGHLSLQLSLCSLTDLFENVTFGCLENLLFPSVDIEDFFLCSINMGTCGGFSPSSFVQLNLKTPLIWQTCCFVQLTLRTYFCSIDFSESFQNHSVNLEAIFFSLKLMLLLSSI